jgi:hypothetical protein
MRRAGGIWCVLALGAAMVAAACARPSPRALQNEASAATRLAYIDQFDTLWTRFSDVYPSFDYKHIDWKAQRATYRPRAARARSQDELIAVLREMLEPLRDLHVWFVDPRGQIVPTYRPAAVANFDKRRWESALRDANYVQRAPTAGDASVGGYAYFYIGSWRPPVDDALLDLMLQRARDAQGLIIDVRTNAGGSDAAALAFAGRFTLRPFAGSYVQIRTDPRVRDVEMPLARTIAPRGGWQFTRPVVVIAGRGGFSATESFVAAMRTLPQVTIIGDTTGGASGNPATYGLGNGWQFTVPRWLEFAPDKRPIEWRGVAPHLAIRWDPQHYDSARDPLIDAAVGLLGERTGVYRIAPAGSGDLPAPPRDPREQR